MEQYWLWYVRELHCWWAHIVRRRSGLVECIIKLGVEHKVGAIRALVVFTHVRLLLVAVCREVKFPRQHVQGQCGLEESMGCDDLLVTGARSVT